MEEIAKNEWKKEKTVPGNQEGQILSNPFSIVIPCHRMIPEKMKSNGVWGSEDQKNIIDLWKKEKIMKKVIVISAISKKIR